MTSGVGRISAELFGAAERVAEGRLFEPEWLTPAAWLWWCGLLAAHIDAFGRTAYGAWLFERNICDHHLDLYSAAMVAESEGL